jgi:predicted double-glycine peptidase
MDIYCNYFGSINLSKGLDIPIYKQGREDYACGPVCICMVLDYLLQKAGMPKLDHDGIRKVGELTMSGRIWSTAGTQYKKMKSVIRVMGFRCREVSGEKLDVRLTFLKKAISHENPVILGCMADLDGERYRHYIVLNWIDHEYLYFNDPYPGRRPAKIRIKKFASNGNEISWGNNRWGIEVFR